MGKGDTKNPVDKKGAGVFFTSAPAPETDSKDARLKSVAEAVNSAEGQVLIDSKREPGKADGRRIDYLMTLKAPAAAERAELIALMQERGEEFAKAAKAEKQKAAAEQARTEMKAGLFGELNSAVGGKPSEIKSSHRSNTGGSDASTTSDASIASSSSAGGDVDTLNEGIDAAKGKPESVKTKLSRMFHNK